MTGFDAIKIREDFPFLKRKTKTGKTPIYLDSAATTQKPVQVINALTDYYENKNANPHRGIYELSEIATEEYEQARKKTAGFINAGESEIIFTRNATEAANLVKNSFAAEFLEKGDRILVSGMEHHANIIPWLMLKKKGVELDYIEITPEGKLEENWEDRITPKTRMVCVTHASNVLGTINDVKEICKIAREKGCVTVVDGAQAAPHFKPDMKEIGCDFYAFSGHKMLGPMGIGVLYGRKELLEKMPPFLGGGDMIRSVERQSAEWNDIPYKFEAGTPNVEGAVGLGAAIDYLNGLGWENMRNHEEKLTGKVLEELSKFEKIRVLGPLDTKERVGAVAFTHAKIHPHDLASVMDAQSIAIRSGHHCAMPLHKTLGIPASARASFYVYNTAPEIDAFAEALRDAEKIFRVK